MTYYQAIVINTRGVGDGQGGLACCNSWGRKESDTTERLNWIVKKIHQSMQEMWVRSLGQEDPLEEEMATHFSILAWTIPWTEEPGRLQSMGSQSQTGVCEWSCPHWVVAWESINRPMKQKCSGLNGSPERICLCSNFQNLWKWSHLEK